MAIELRNLSDEQLTRAVVQSFGNAPSERTRELLQSLVAHLHAFASEVQLTEEEWAAGIDFLTRTGQACSDTRQEFILLSDVLGMSMLTVGINNPQVREATESTVFGPFFVEGSPEYRKGDDIANGAPGAPCLMEGEVRGLDGAPVAGARMEIWQADEEGLYDVQYDDLGQPRGRRPNGDLAGGGGGPLRRPVGRPGPAAGPRAPVPRRRRPLQLLVGAPRVLRHPRRRPGRRAAARRRPRLDAPRPRALHDHGARLPQADDARLRRRGPAPRCRRGVRRQELADHELRAPPGRHGGGRAHAGRAVLLDELRLRARAGLSDAHERVDDARIELRAGAAEQL